MLKLSLFQEGHVILGGDLNCVLNNYLYRFANSSSAQCFRNWGKPNRNSSGLQDILTRFDLLDTWRHINPSARDYTFFSPRFHSYLRIDFVLVSSSLLHTVTQSDKGIRHWLDHAPVLCWFKIGGVQQKDKHWVLNKTILMKEHYVQELKQQTGV